MGNEFLLAPHARKKAALISQLFRLDPKSALQFCFFEDQEWTFTSGMGTRNCPPHCRMQAICRMISSLRFHGKISK